jgi:hypothetical protein
MNRGIKTSQLVRANPKFPGLPLRLRMMTLELNGPHGNEQTVEGILNDLVTTNADTLEGLAAHIHRIRTSTKTQIILHFCWQHFQTSPF